jgi:hypothetical protein
VPDDAQGRARRHDTAREQGRGGGLETVSSPAAILGGLGALGHRDRRLRHGLAGSWGRLGAAGDGTARAASSTATSAGKASRTHA